MGVALRKTMWGMWLEQQCHVILEMMKTKTTKNQKPQNWLLETDIPERLSRKDAGGSQDSLLPLRLGIFIRPWELPLKHRCCPQTPLSCESASLSWTIPPVKDGGEAGQCWATAPQEAGGPSRAALNTGDAPMTPPLLEVL